MAQGFILGVLIAGYMYLHKNAIGFTFPNIDGLHSLRPTWIRVASYLMGRWLGYVLLGMLLGAAGTFASGAATHRFFYAFACFGILFVLLFLATNHSPEMQFAERFELKHLQIPVFFNGVFSVVTLIAPLGVAVFLVMGKYSGMRGAFFFTYLFLGYAILSLPQLFNIKWFRRGMSEKVFRFILTVLSVLLLASILHEFIDL